MTEAERLAQRLEEDLDLSRWGQTIADQAAALLRSQAAEIEALRALLNRCRPIIEADAQMMADITRHAPLDPKSQAEHDSTEYESEKLLREFAAIDAARQS